MKRKILMGIFATLAVACCLCLCFSVVSVINNGTFPEIGSHFNPGAKVYDLQVLSTKGGSVNVPTGQFESNTVVNLEAYPDDGYVFSGWFDKSDNYITSSENYTFAISEETKLYAKFGLEPEEISGTAAYSDELKDRSSDFSFTIKSNQSKEWLEENLKIVDDDFIGTEFEDYEEVNVDFSVEEKGDGEFLIKPIGEYDAGITYTAKIEEEVEEDDTQEVEVSFLENSQQGDSLTFSIEKEETNIVENKDGIIYLSMDEDVVSLFDDGFMSGDEGDLEDKVILTKTHGIIVGSIICIYSGELDTDGNPVMDENTIYGKCVSIKSVAAGYEIVYDAPDITEIYEKLDIYVQEDVDFEEAGAEITEETIEEIKYAFLSQEEFHEFLAAINVAVKEEGEKKGYEVEELGSKDKKAENFLDAFDIKIVPVIKGDTLSIKIYVSANIPLSIKDPQNKNQSKQVAQFSASIEFKKDIKFKVGFNYQIRKWWFLPVGVKSYDAYSQISTTDYSTFKFTISYDKGSAGIKELDKNQIYENCVEAFSKKKNITTEKNKIQELFKDAGYDNGSRREIKLFNVRYYFSVVTANIDVKFFMDFDIAGSLYYTSTSTTSSRIGFRSSNGGVGRFYQEKGGSTSVSDAGFAGSVGIKTGASAETYFSVAGLSKYMKAGIGVEAGIEVGLEGYIVPKKGYSAGCLEANVFVNGYAFYKLFSISGRTDFATWEKNIIKLGYDKTIMSWVNQEEITDDDYTLNIIGKTDLFNNPDFAVYVYTTGENIEIENLKWNSKAYSVEVNVVDGEWLEYKEGCLIVKSGAPISFRDKIKIAVKSSNVWGKFKNDSYCSYIKEIEIDVLYGNEDAYYNSIDSNIEKEFRRLYRSYNGENAEILETLLGNLIDKLVSEENAKSEIYVPIVNEYTDALFKTIDEYKDKDDKERTMENLFVYTEAEVFVESINWLNEMTEEKEYDEDEFKELVVEIGKSEVMYNMLYELSTAPEYKETIEKFDLSFDEKQKLAENLNWYRTNGKDLPSGRTTDDVIKIFDNIFDLGELVWKK